MGGGDGLDGDADGLGHEGLAALADFEVAGHTEAFGECLREAAGLGLDGDDGVEVVGFESSGELFGGDVVPAGLAGEVEGVDAEAAADVDEWDVGAAVGPEVDGVGWAPGFHGRVGAKGGWGRGKANKPCAWGEDAWLVAGGQMPRAAPA